MINADEIFEWREIGGGVKIYNIFRKYECEVKEMLKGLLIWIVCGKLCIIHVRNRWHQYYHKQLSRCENPDEICW